MCDVSSALFPLYYCNRQPADYIWHFFYNRLAKCTPQRMKPESFQSRRKVFVSWRTSVRKSTLFWFHSLNTETFRNFEGRHSIRPIRGDFGRQMSFTSVPLAYPIQIWQSLRDVPESEVWSVFRYLLACYNSPHTLTTRMMKQAFGIIAALCR